MSGFDIHNAFANAIKATGDPLAPIKLQNAHANVTAVGKMLVPLSTANQARVISERLLKDFTDTELDKPNPTLVIVLCNLLCEAMILLGRDFGNDPSLHRKG